MESNLYMKLMFHMSNIIEQNNWHVTFKHPCGKLLTVYNESYYGKIATRKRIWID